MYNNHKTSNATVNELSREDEDSNHYKKFILSFTEKDSQFHRCALFNPGAFYDCDYQEKQLSKCRN